jgi:hypothetical protein
MRLSEVAFLLLWASVPLTFWGVGLRDESPQFDSWAAEEGRKWQEGPGRSTHNGLGPMLSMTGGFELMVNSLIATAFSVGLFMSHLLMTRGPKLLRVIPVVFSLGCLWGVLIGLKSGFNCCLWGFFVLGGGYGLASVGLACGVVSIWRTPRGQLSGYFFPPFTGRTHPAAPAAPS